MIGRNALILLGFLLSSTANADPVKIAVAANFAKVAEALANDFEADGNGKIAIVIGSTGALYLQITQGAPFEAFLAADQERPARLEAKGLTISGSRFTYALGNLVLYSRRGP
ncbi:MAG: molybdate ABC transporter substrate-binding protein, partial [Rhodospirillales bacterium]